MNKPENVSLTIGESGSQPHKPPVKLFGLAVSKLSETPRFLFLSGAVFLFYLLYGYMLELIFTLDGMRPHGWFLTLIQFAYYTIFALIQITLSGDQVIRKIPLRTYVIIALLTVGTMGFSNSSVGYLNYPTQVIFKSCKLIPVMIGSVLILGKRYSFAEVVACVCMSLGLIWFTLADSTVQPNFSIIGVVLVSLALFCDAVIGNVQEGAMKKYNEGTTHVVLYSYSIGFFIILAGLVASGQLLPGVTFGAQHPWEVYGRSVMLSVAGFCGVQVVLTLVTLSGALVAVTVTTFRKALTVCLSFILFSKPFTIQYLWGGLLVVAGIYLNVYSKRSKASPPLMVSLQQLYMQFQRQFAPKISKVQPGNSPAFSSGAVSFEGTVKDTGRTIYTSARYANSISLPPKYHRHIHFALFPEVWTFWKGENYRAPHHHKWHTKNTKPMRSILKPTSSQHPVSRQTKINYGSEWSHQRGHYSSQPMCDLINGSTNHTPTVNMSPPRPIKQNGLGHWLGNSFTAQNAHHADLLAAIPALASPPALHSVLPTATASVSTSAKYLLQLLHELHS